MLAAIGIGQAIGLAEQLGFLDSLPSWTQNIAKAVGQLSGGDLLGGLNTLRDAVGNSGLADADKASINGQIDELWAKANGAADEAEPGEGESLLQRIAKLLGELMDASFERMQGHANDLNNLDDGETVKYGSISAQFQAEGQIANILSTLINQLIRTLGDSISGVVNQAA